MSLNYSLLPLIGINRISSLDKRYVQTEEPRVKYGGRILNLIDPLLKIPGWMLKFPIQVIRNIIGTIFPRPNPRPTLPPNPPPRPHTPPPRPQTPPPQTPEPTLCLEYDNVQDCNYYSKEDYLSSEEVYLSSEED